MASSSSSSSSRLSKYDAFISFRGYDTRKSFVSHLYKTLDYKGIVTFEDNRRLELGDCITDELVKAIKDSKFSIVVISENYGDSGWCLEELRLIMELHMKHKLTALPIFYKIEPSDVRHLKGKFGVGFEKLASRISAEKVREWREALTQVANLSGKDSNVCKDEASMIDEIVGDILRRLFHLRPRAGRNILGMEAHMKELNPMLDIESENEVRMIGIWGMGGIGKTTIAEHLYDQILLRFSPFCFIGNAKHIIAQHGASQLWAKVLSHILREDLFNYKIGCQEIQARLGHKKVLLILDDVDSVFQLQPLFDKPESLFGPGSRIIIITRDKGLLNSLRVRTVYNVKFLKKEDALRIFKEIAFKGGRPPSEEYERLSVQASRLARGLPSAVEDLGIYLRGKTTIEEWECELDSFEDTPHKNVIQIFKMSVEGLDEKDKINFLYIATLFNGDPVKRVAALLGDNGSRIKALAEKSLLQISTYKCITIHSFVVHTGRYFVRQESGNISSIQRTLWDPREIYNVLEDNSGTDRIEGVSLNISEIPHNMSLRRIVFNEMKNLKFLKFYKRLHKSKFKLELSSDLDFLPRQLILLQWDAYPLKTLPSGFLPQCLVELIMHHSDLESLWEGTPELRNLRRLDVTGCKNLRQLPNFSNAINLEDLITKGCKELRQIPESIVGLSSLKKLDLSNCDGLPRILVQLSYGGIMLKFPNATLELKSPAHVSIEAKIEIQIATYFRGFAENFSFTSVPHNTAEEMMLRSPRFYGFKSLDIMRFNYNELPCYDEILHYDEFPRHFRYCDLSDFPLLEELNLVNLNLRFVKSYSGELLVLEKLDLSGNDFVNLPSAMKYLTKLKYLCLRNCRKLEKLPVLTQVETLILSNCINLRSFLKLPEVEEDKRRFCLLELGLDNCNNIKSLSDQLSHLTNLKELDLSRHDFEALPSTIEKLSSLETLSLNYCSNLVSVKGLPLSLKRLYAHGCHSLQTLFISHNDPLEDLDMGHCPRLKKDDLITRFGNKLSLRCGCSQSDITVRAHL